jgi:hypothetical protein
MESHRAGSIAFHAGVPRIHYMDGNKGMGWLDGWDRAREESDRDRTPPAWISES